MSRDSLRVVKLGGSLLDLEDLHERFRCWNQAFPAVQQALVIGGGPPVDWLRGLAARLEIDEPTAHWLAVDAMQFTAAAVGQAFKLSLAASAAEFAGGRATATSLVLSPREWLRHEEPSAPGTRLPHSWDVTSDSIAARLAEVLGFHELVLLKSRLPGIVVKPAVSRGLKAVAHTQSEFALKAVAHNEQESRLQILADEGLVDRHFPQAARGLRVTVVDFRSSGFPSRGLCE